MAPDPTLIARLDAQGETLDRVAFTLADMAETQIAHTRLLERLAAAAEEPSEGDGRLTAMLRAILKTLKENGRLLEALAKTFPGRAKP